MGKMYQNPEKRTVSRILKPRVKLQWREEPLRYPSKSRAPSREARELNSLMEADAAQRSAAIAAPGTNPLVRRQLIEEEERLAQAYHHLATRSRGSGSATIH